MRAVIPLLLLAGCGPGLLRHEEPPLVSPSPEALDWIGPFLLRVELHVHDPGTGKVLLILNLDLCPSGDAPPRASIEEILLKWADKPGERRWLPRPEPAAPAVLRHTLTEWVDASEPGSQPRVYVRVRAGNDHHERWVSPSILSGGRP